MTTGRHIIFQSWKWKTKIIWNYIKKQMQENTGNQGELNHLRNNNNILNMAQ